MKRIKTKKNNSIYIEGFSAKIDGKVDNTDAELLAKHKDAKAPFNVLYATANNVFHRVDLVLTNTEAAAATAVVMGLRSIPPPPVIFRVDRPFLFLIQDNQTGSILFMGRVNDPTKTGE